MIFINISKETKQKIFKFLKIGLFFILIYIFIKYLGTFFLPFILGYFLCLLLYPLFKVFNEVYKIPQFISGLLCISILLFLVSFVGVGIVGQIVKEAKGFLADLPYYIESVKATFDSIEIKITKLLDIFPDSLENFLLTLSENSKYFLSEFLGSGVKNTSVEFIKKIPNAFMILVLSVISCYLILVDKANIENFVLRQIPKNYLSKVTIMKQSIGKAFVGYVKAQLIIMCLIATICFVGLTIIKAPYSLLIAVIIGIVDALPVFGSGFVLWPWALYNLITKNYGMAIGLIIIYIVVLISRQFIEPKILGKQIGVHPLVTLMSIYIGLKVFGILGFIIGPAIMIIIKALQEENIIPNWR